MFRLLRFPVVLFLVLAAVAATGTVAAQTNPCAVSGVDENGALYYISVPINPVTGGCYWGGDLVVFAHGYVAANEPLAIPWGQMALPNPADPTQPVMMPDLVNSMGFGFATTSYRKNGLAIQEGIADVVNLAQLYAQLGGSPYRVYLIGASEGSLVTTLAIERRPDVFSGGMAMCGPIGSFQGQVNYWGDFRAVYDFFMDRPGFNALPGNVVSVPEVMINKWDSVYVPRILGTITDLNRTSQVISVTGAAIDPSNPVETVPQTVLGILWYNAFATKDAIAELGGNPYDNRDRQYTNSSNDPLLNTGVKRYKANAKALKEIADNYETNGQLQRPLVTMHTRGDPIIPYWHLIAYQAKVGANPLLYDISVDTGSPRYGHCNFTLDEIIDGFITLQTAVGP